MNPLSLRMEGPDDALDVFCSRSFSRRVSDCESTGVDNKDDPKNEKQFPFQQTLKVLTSHWVRLKPQKISSGFSYCLCLLNKISRIKVGLQTNYSMNLGLNLGS